MARGDGTGPDGIGPMTGRRMGFCAGFDRPGYANPGFGRGRGFGRGFGHGFRAFGRDLGRGLGFRGGFGRGFGRGFGWRHMSYGPAVQPADPIWEPTFAREPTKEEGKQLLQEEARAVEEEQKALIGELNSIKKRLAEIE